MSVTNADRDQTQSTATDDLHLTTVQIVFNEGRPKGRLKLIVTLNNEDHIVEAGEYADLRWTGSIRCSLPSITRVCICHRRWMRWEDFASIEVSLSLDSLLASDTLQIFQTSATIEIADSVHPMVVTFTISESSAFSRIKAVREQEEKAAAEKVAREQVEKAAREQAQKKYILRKLGDVRSVLDILELTPLAVGAATSALDGLVQICEREDSHCEGVMKWVTSFDPFLSVRARVNYLAQNAEARRAAEVMLNLVRECSEYILSCTSSSSPGDNSGPQIRFSSLFLAAKATFDHSLEPIIQAEFLRWKLLGCRGVLSIPGAEDTCLDGTRVELLMRVMNWVGRRHTNSRPSIFWLRGRVGAGKTTVANTLARAAQKRGYLVSSFSCRQDNQNLPSPSLLLSALAYHFAQHNESYRKALYLLLRTSRGADISTTTDINILFDTLFNPLKETVDPEHSHVVIINSLADSGLSSDRVTLAQCLLTLSRIVPRIKIFVTSRDEPTIRGVFTSDACFQRNIDEEKDIDHDIKLYIRWQASRLDSVQLSDEDIERLVGRAEGLFIWCSTLFNYLRKYRAPKEHLQLCISNKKCIGPWNRLCHLYDTILEFAAETLQDASFMRAVLAIVDVASSNRPLSAKAIAIFLRDHKLHTARHEDHVDAVIVKLQAVLYVDNSMSAVIRARHSSFYHYLRQKSTGAVSGWERYEDVHGRMFRCCIRILDTQLRFNMCKIEIPVLNEDVPDLAQRVAENMSEELQYSSLFWCIHLSLSVLTKADAAPGVSSLLCSKKLLFWLESLSLRDSLSQSLLAFEVCTRFFHGFFDILAAANNARRAVSYLSKAMDSVPHIYLSSLFWLPRNSRTSRDLELARLKHLQLIENGQDDWEAVVWKQSEGHELYSVMFSPDGQYVASGADNGAVYIQNARTGALEREISSGSDMPISSLAYSPDGSLIASGSSDNIVRVWDVRSAKEVFRPLTGHTGSVNSVAFSPDGQSIASSSHDGTVRVWNARTGLPEGEPLRGHKGWVLDLAYSPHSLHIASAGYDCDVRVWSTITHQETVRISCGHQRGIQSVAFSPDGYTITSGSRDYTIRRWDARTGQAVGEPFRGHTGSVWSVIYTPDGFFILSSSEDCTIRIWDAMSGAPVGEVLCGHQGWVRSVSCFHDGLFIASASDDMAIRVWDAHTDSKTPDQVHRGHSEGVITVAWSPDSRQIATGSRDRMICLWDAETGAAIGEPLRGHGGAVLSVVFSPDSLFIASGSDDYTVRIWDVQTGNFVDEPLRGHSDRVQSVACSPDGRCIASASEDNTVRLWDVQTRSQIGEPLQVGGWALSVAFSPDGHSLACGSDIGIQIWDVTSKASLKATLGSHSGRAWSVAFSPDGRSIASASYNGDVRIWDAQTGKQRGSSLTGHTDWVHCIAFSPDSCLVASCSDDHTVRLWDARTGQAVGDPLRGHSHRVWYVAFSPDGRSLASAGDDRKTYVYNVPSADPSLADIDARWSTCCSRMDEEDGWIKDGDMLLLWIPPLYRPVIRAGAYIMINEDGAVTSRVDVETLFQYSGKEWVNILSYA